MWALDFSPNLLRKFKTSSPFHPVLQEYQEEIRIRMAFLAKKYGMIGSSKAAA
jgi:hypothetical protein